MYAPSKVLKTAEGDRNAATTATETRAEWKREAVQKAAKDEQRKQKLQPLLKDSQPSAIASNNLILRK